MKERIAITTTIQAFTEVFKNVRYVLVAAAGTIIALLFAVWLPNLSLIARIVGNAGVPLSVKARLLVGLSESISANFSTFSASSTIAIAILFGTDLALVLYLFHRDKLLERGELAASAGGIASGVLGVGCAACGSFILSSVLSLIGAAGVIALLPLKGGEFGILGIVLLSISIYTVSRKIKSPMVCNPIVEP